MFRTLEAVDSVIPLLNGACAWPLHGLGTMTYWSMTADSNGVVDDSLRGRAALVDSVRMICYGLPPYFGAQRGGVGEAPAAPAPRASTGPVEQCGGESILPTPPGTGLNLTVVYWSFGHVYNTTLTVANEEADGIILRQRLAALPNVLGRLAAGLRTLDAATDLWITIGFTNGAGQLIALGNGQQHAPSAPIMLRYQVGWGDCPSGCIDRHTWTIRVDQRKQGHEMVPSRVRIVREEGPKVPPGGIYGGF